MPLNPRTDARDSVPPKLTKRNKRAEKSADGKSVRAGRLVRRLLVGRLLVVSPIRGAGSPLRLLPEFFITRWRQRWPLGGLNERALAFALLAIALAVA